MDKILGDDEASLKAINAGLESLGRHFAEQDTITQGFSGWCDAKAPGVSLVQTLLGSVEKGTDEASTRVESFAREEERLSWEKSNISFLFVRTSFTGKELETMTKGSQHAQTLDLAE